MIEKNSHGGMEELPGVLGTSSSFALRLGQAVFSSASLFFMCLDVDFYGYSAFWLAFLIFCFFFFFWVCLILMLLM